MKRQHLVLTVVALAAAWFTAGCGNPQEVISTRATSTRAAGTPQVAATETAIPPYNGRAPFETYEKSVMSFDDFPILWLGASFDSDGDGVGDMPLRSAYAARYKGLFDPRNGAEILPPETSFTLGYGDCTIAPGDQSCPGPLTIVFHSAEEPCPRFAGGDGTVRVRGVDATTYDGGSLRVRTADFIVTISATADNNADRLALTTRIANQLVGANAKASQFSATTTDFRPRTSEPPPCPPRFPTPPSGDVTATPTVGVVVTTTAEQTLVPQGDAVPASPPFATVVAGDAVPGQ